MKRELRSTLRMSFTDLPICLGLAAGFWLLGEIIIFFIVFFDETATKVPPIGPLVSLFGGAFAMCIVDLSRIFAEFRMFVRFSATRRGVLAGEVATMLYQGAAAMAVTFALALLTVPLHAALFPHLQSNNALFFGLPWFAWPAVLFLPPLLGIACGGLIVRFGRRAGWLLYALFMIGSLCLGSIAEFFEANPGLLSYLALLVLPVLGLTAASVFWLLHAGTEGF